MLSVAVTGIGAVTSALGTLAELLDEAQQLAFDRSSKLAVVAAKLAFADAGGPSHDPASLGVYLGSTHGCLPAQIELDRVVLTEGPQALRGSLFPYAAFNATAANVAIVLHARGPNLTVSTGRVAGTDACADGARQIASGAARAMLVGGVEASNADVHAWRSALGSSRDPQGEGAVVFLLESADVAARRGARVYGTILGASSFLADDDSLEARTRASVSAAREALAEADRDAADVSLVVGDVDGLGDLFSGRVVPRLSATAALGDTLSASGAADIMMALLSAHAATRGTVLAVSCSPEGLTSSLVFEV